MEPDPGVKDRARAGAWGKVPVVAAEVEVSARDQGDIVCALNAVQKKPIKGELPATSRNAQSAVSP
jgi:hypothetical protein